MAARLLPVKHQFIAMLLTPFQCVREGSDWKLPFDHAIHYVDCDLMLAIDCMEICWIMISMQDSYRDPKKAANS